MATLRARGREPHRSKATKPCYRGTARQRCKPLHRLATGVVEGAHTGKEQSDASTNATQWPLLKTSIRGL